MQQFGINAELFGQFIIGALPHFGAVLPRPLLANFALDVGILRDPLPQLVHFLPDDVKLLVLLSLSAFDPNHSPDKNYQQNDHRNGPLFNSTAESGEIVA